jgi:hypothetical protein
MFGSRRKAVGVTFLVLALIYICIPRYKFHYNRLYHKFHPNNASTHRIVNVRKALERSEAVYTRYVVKRSSFIVHSRPHATDPWEPHICLFDYFLPSFDCPFSVERLGRMGDGGKWVCGIELFEIHSPFRVKSSSNGPCIVYSLGVGNETSFEEEILNRTNCQIFVFDASEDNLGYPVLEKHPRAHSTRIKTSSVNSGVVTLGTLMRQLGHNWIDILKMDVKGNEFSAVSVLEQAMQDFPNGLPFGQIQMEVHFTEGIRFAEMYGFWERFENAGMRPFKNEMKHFDVKGKPNVAEYAFMNAKRLYRLFSLV